MSTYNCTTTTKPPCIDPLTYFLNRVLEIYHSGNYNTIDEALDDVLDNGIVVNSCNFCCDQCDYVLGNFQAYFTYTTPIISSPPLIGANTTAGIPICCTNVYSSVETYLSADFSSSILGDDKAPEIASCSSNISCCNNFKECVLEIACNAKCFDFEIILNKGIIEAQAPNKLSGLCKIIEFLKEHVNPETCFVDLLDVILDKGIVIYCDPNGRIVFGSVETVLSYQFIPPA
jgi:hypothetical protein